MCVTILLNTQSSTAADYNIEYKSTAHDPVVTDTLSVVVIVLGKYITSVSLCEFLYSSA